MRNWIGIVIVLSLSSAAAEEATPLWRDGHRHTELVSVKRAAAIDERILEVLPEDAINDRDAKVCGFDVYEFQRLDPTLLFAKAEAESNTFTRGKDGEIRRVQSVVYHVYVGAKP